MSVMKPHSYVEMEVLHAIWPSELNGYRVMLVSFQEVGTQGFYGFQSIATYTPDAGPFDTLGRWMGKDVIMTLKNGHFTLLNPAYGDERNSNPWSACPIDDLMAAIEAYNAGTSLVIFHSSFVHLSFNFPLLTGHVFHFPAALFLRYSIMHSLTLTPPSPPTTHRLTPPPPSFPHLHYSCSHTTIPPPPPPYT